MYISRILFSVFLLTARHFTNKYFHFLSKNCRAGKKEVPLLPLIWFVVYSALVFQTSSETE